MLPHHHLYEAAWGAAALTWGLRGALLLRRASRGAAPWPRLAGLLTLVVATTVLGARLHFVLLAPELFRASGWGALLLPLADGAGLRITGGLLGGAATILLLGPGATAHRLGRAEISDVLVPAAGPAIAVGRLGCLADGCCFGIPCTAPWCVRFPAASPAYWSHVAQGLIGTSAATSLPVHPVELYLGGTALLASGLSLLARSRAHGRDGARALTFVALLSLLRAAIEPLREASFGAGVPHETGVDLLIAAAALAALAWRVRPQRAPARVASGS